MNATPFLAKAFEELDKALQGSLNGTKIEKSKDTIRRFAIAAAVAGLIAGAAPGVAGVVAALTETGLIWATYVKINQTLGISMKEHTAKFIAAAVMTNLTTYAASILLAYAFAALTSIIPIVGNAAASALNAVLGYMIIYASAIIYLNLISKFVRPDGTVEIPESVETKEVIKEIIKNSDLRGMFREGRRSYKEAQADGSIAASLKLKVCPRCGATVKPGQHFCSGCGMDLINPLDD